ncbi:MULTISPECIES: hypothetical protein [unclassified Micromonospora]|uniref:hypothetical protein n=1 Tax=unclassified Micromonospora TaxID=2617518 RepID=UPI002FEE80A1
MKGGEAAATVIEVDQPDGSVLVVDRAFEMDSAEDVIDQMAPRTADMVSHNPHADSIQDRGTETPGWLSFLRLTTDLGSVTVLESTDGFGRTVAAYQGLGITF